MSFRIIGISSVTNHVFGKSQIGNLVGGKLLPYFWLDLELSAVIYLRCFEALLLCENDARFKLCSCIIFVESVQCCINNSSESIIWNSVRAYVITSVSSFSSDTILREHSHRSYSLWASRVFFVLSSLCLTFCVLFSFICCL